MPAERRVSVTEVAPVCVREAVAVFAPAKSDEAAYSIVAVPDEAPVPKDETSIVTIPRVGVSDAVAAKEKSGNAGLAVATVNGSE